MNNQLIEEFLKVLEVKEFTSYNVVEIGGTIVLRIALPVKETLQFVDELNSFKFKDMSISENNLILRYVKTNKE